MIETGKPFKMKPLTRKAENALRKASEILGIHREEVRWKRLDSGLERKHLGLGSILVVADGDTDHATLRWVAKQNDPDWKIV